MDTRLAMTAWALVCGLTGAVHGEGNSTAAPLGKRFFDLANGYSLRPPAGLDFKQEYSPSRLATWSARDDATGAIAWTFRVLRAVESDSYVEPSAHVKTLRHRLEGKDKFKLESIELIQVAGWLAIELAGQSDQPAGQYNRQLWVQSQAGQFVIFSIAGPIDRRARLDAVFKSILDTLDIFDPQQFQQRRQENLAQGRQLLEGLNQRRIEGIADGVERFLLITIAGQPVGFVRTRIDLEHHQQVPAVKVLTLTWMDSPDSNPSIARQELLARLDHQHETWMETVVSGTGPSSHIASEAGSREGQLITVDITSGPRRSRQVKAIPAEILNVYLSRSIGVIMPSLLEQSIQTAYAFAVFNTQAGEFDVRTIAVAGPEQITVGDQTLDAVRITDQVAEDVEPTVLWLDRDGHAVRILSNGGLVLQAATQQQVLSAFPAQREHIEGPLTQPGAR